MILRILHLEGSTIRNIKGFDTKQKWFQIETWKSGSLSSKHSNYSTERSIYTFSFTHKHTHTPTTKRQQHCKTFCCDAIQRLRQSDGITDPVGVSLRKLWETVKDREAWRATDHGVPKNQTQLSDWTKQLPRVTRISCDLETQKAGRGHTACLNSISRNS